MLALTWRPAEGLDTTQVSVKPQASSRCFSGEISNMNRLSQTLSTIHQVMPGNLRRIWINRIQLFCTVFMGNLMPHVNTAAPQIMYRGPNHAVPWKSSTQQWFLSQLHPTTKLWNSHRMWQAAAHGSKCQGIEGQLCFFVGAGCLCTSTKLVALQ